MHPKDKEKQKPQEEITKDNKMTKYSYVKKLLEADMNPDQQSRFNKQAKHQKARLRNLVFNKKTGKYLTRVIPGVGFTPSGIRYKKDARQHSQDIWDKRRKIKNDILAKDKQLKIKQKQAARNKQR